MKKVLVVLAFIMLIAGTALAESHDFTNNSGSTISQYALVELDTGTDNSVKDSDHTSYAIWYGAAQNEAADSETVYVNVGGRAYVIADGAITMGDYVRRSSNNDGECESAGADPVTGIFGVAESDAAGGYVWVQFLNTQGEIDPGTGTSSLTFVIDDDNAGAEPANGAGIKIEGGAGTDVTFLYDATDNVMDLNYPLGFEDDEGLWFGTDDDMTLYYDETTDDRLEITDGTNLLAYLKDEGTTGSLGITDDLYLLDDKYIKFGTDEDIIQGYDEAVDDRLEWTDGSNLLAYLTDNANEGDLGLTGNLLLEDDDVVSYGTDADVRVGYDETTDDRLEWSDGTNLLMALTDGGAVGNLYVTGTLTVDGNIDMGGGALDGTTIGGATPDAGTFTALTATGNTSVGDNEADTFMADSTLTETAADDPAKLMHEVMPVNLLANGGFEVWSNGANAAPDGWTFSGGDTPRRVSTPYKGTYAAILDGDGVGEDSVGFYLTDDVGDWIKGKPFVLAVYARGAAGGESVTIDVRDGDDTVQGSAALSITNSYVRYYATGTFGAAGGDPYVLFYVTGSTDVVYFDNAALFLGQGAWEFGQRPIYAAGDQSFYGALSISDDLTAGAEDNTLIWDTSAEELEVAGAFNVLVGDVDGAGDMTVVLPSNDASDSFVIQDSDLATVFAVDSDGDTTLVGNLTTTGSVFQMGKFGAFYILKTADPNSILLQAGGAGFIWLNDVTLVTGTLTTNDDATFGSSGNYLMWDESATELKAESSLKLLSQGANDVNVILPDAAGAQSFVVMDSALNPVWEVDSDGGVIMESTGTLQNNAAFGSGFWFDGDITPSRAFLGIPTAVDTPFRLYSTALLGNAWETDLTTGDHEIAGDLTVSGGDADFGVDDTVRGTQDIYGGGAGTSLQAATRWYNSADYDTNVQYWAFGGNWNSEDFRIFGYTGAAAQDVMLFDVTDWGVEVVNTLSVGGNTTMTGTLTVNGDQTGATDHVFDEYDDIQLLHDWRNGNPLPFETGDLLNRDRLLRDTIVQLYGEVQTLRAEIETLKQGHSVGVTTYDEVE